MPDVLVDEKEVASRTFADVVDRTAEAFPDERFRPKTILRKDLNSINGFRIEDHYTSGNADGTGTKPELAERLSTFTSDYRYFELPAFDVLAMTADDAAREGAFVVGVYNSLDLNDASDTEFVAALARGMERACKTGQFPLINGETAELGYRTPGWGKNHLNWNAVAKKVINEKKLITGESLKAGQPVVMLRENSVRSNGLTDGRKIMELGYLIEQMNITDRRLGITEYVRQRAEGVSPEHIQKVINNLPGQTDHWEQIQLPWHELYPELTEKLIQPSTIYAPLLYEAQGGVDGAINVPIVACAHVSGGGVPKKAERMLKASGLGVHLDAPFPYPQGVKELIDMAKKYGYTKKGKPFDERLALETWNGSAGMLCVMETVGHANDFVQLAANKGYEAAIAGEITDQRTIEWRGHEWTY